MLKKVSLKNFRCFDHHEVQLKPLSIIVGANNAGKSTLVEALRLLSIVASRYQNLNYYEPPDWTGLPQRCRGVSPSLKNIDLRGGSIFHRYGAPPAVIKGYFTSGARCELYLNVDEVYALIHGPDGQLVTNRAQARNVQLPSIGIQPQIGPLLESEPLRSRDHVLGSLETSLASRHFRNQIHFLPRDNYKDLQLRAEASWHGLHIEGIEVAGELNDRRLMLFVRDGNFSAEIGWMGHGVQMWLQTMWFLARSRKTRTVILDEPDVYMHADLQRKLIRLLRSRKGQTIIATHSVEIMAEVSADEILVIDKRRPNSSFAATLPAVQSTIENLGGVQNIHLAKLWSARKCLHVEGKDVQLLKAFQDVSCPDSDASILSIPSLAIGGWGGWNYAVGSTMNLHNAAGEQIKSYCIFDSDFHLEHEIQNRYDDARKRGIQLHIWRKKEIENYLLVPAAIHRLLLEDATNKERVPNVADITSAMEKFSEELRDFTHDAIANEFLLRDRAGGISQANRQARAAIDSFWNNLALRLERVSGKQLLSDLSGWCKEQCGVSFGSLRVARALTLGELDPEVVQVIRSIDQCEAFGHIAPVAAQAAAGAAPQKVKAMNTSL